MRLKHFESFKGNIDLRNLVKDCFQDLIDDGICEILNNDEFVPELSSSVIVNVDIPEIDKNHTSFGSMFQNAYNYFEIMNSIKTSVDRIENAHSSEIDIDFESEGEYICFFISEGAPNMGEFWKEKTNGTVKIFYDVLKEKLRLPKSVDVGMSTDGSQYMISFSFKDSSELNDYKDDLIKNMCGYKIGNKDIISEHQWSYSTSGKQDISKYKIYTDVSNKKRSNYISFGLNKDINWMW